MKTRFLDSRDLWEKIRERPISKRASAAVAYLGQGGAALLPLRRGHRLVVDMSLRAVSQGVTDPREIRKLKNKGVEIFSRDSLHAKFFLFDDVLIVGSANISKRSRDVLDEGGLMTDDPAAVRQAKAYFEKLCTEPVRNKYLAECLKAYRPPRFKAALEPPKGGRRRGQDRIHDARLWLIGGIPELHLSEQDQVLLDRAENSVRRKAKLTATKELIWIRYPRRPRFYEKIVRGQWIVHSFRTLDGSTVVRGPCQLIAKEPWTSSRGGTYSMLWVEEAPKAQDMSWSDFRRRIRKLIPTVDSPRHLTRPITSRETADSILQWWTPQGRVSS